MARLRIIVVAQETDGDAYALATCKFYAPGTATASGSSTSGTPFAGNLYAAISGGSPISTTQTLGSNGTLVVWTTSKSRVDVGIEPAGGGTAFVRQYEAAELDPADVLTLLDTQVLIPDGTASLPGLAFASDANTGIYRSGADTINITTGGTSRLSVDSTGTLASPGSASLATTAGETVSISQDWTEESVFALQVVKSFRATGALVGSANATFNQIARDDSTSGGDMTTAKITQHWSGSNVTASATVRGLEVEAIRYAATAGTGSATTHGAVTAASMKYGSTRGIDIGLAHDPAIVDAAIYTYGLTGLNVFNVGAGSVDGKSWGSGGNKGTAGVNIWGTAGFQYGIIYSGPSTPDQLLTTTTGRIFHVRESGGNDGLLYQTSNTVGTGIRFAATGGGGRNLDVFAVGSAVGAPHTGKVALYDATGGIYLLSAGVNASDTTKGQIGVIGGTDAYPGLVGYSDLDTGLVWAGANVLAVSIGGTRVATVNSSGLGIGGAASGNLLYLNGAAALRIDNTANWQTTVGAAGAASALPATPLGYLKVNLGGTTVVVPYYTAS